MKPVQAASHGSAEGAYHRMATGQEIQNIFLFLKKKKFILKLH